MYILFIVPDEYPENVWILEYREPTPEKSVCAGSDLPKPSLACHKFLKEQQ
jgi:hypothetical protein